MAQVSKALIGAANAAVANPSAGANPFVAGIQSRQSAADSASVNHSPGVSGLDHGLTLAQCVQIVHDAVTGRRVREA
jgi:hypothetical protein